MARGGEFLKWTCPQNAGVPDRILILDGKILFVEMKKHDGGLSVTQERMHRRLNLCLGDNPVRVISGGRDVELLMEELSGE